MQPNESSKKKRRQLTSQDLKRRLYEKGMNGKSMPSLKNPLTIDKPPVLYVNLNSSGNKTQGISSPKILKKTASAFGNKSRDQKRYFPNITANEFNLKKKTILPKSPKGQIAPITPPYKTAMNFFLNKRSETETQEEGNQFNSSFYKVDSTLRNNQTRMTKRLVEKMSGHRNRNRQQAMKSRFAEDEPRQASPGKSPQKDQQQLIQRQEVTTKQPQQLSPNLPSKQQQPYHHHHHHHQQSSLQEYISLILKNVPNLDQFLYLIRHKTAESLPEQDNVYQLEIIDYQEIKQKDKQPNFEYYTISKKGFCHYYGGKPIQFIDLKEWLQEKEIYEKIKKLKFFSRFRRWKTIKMWITKVVRHRIQKCSLALQQKLFLLNPTVRSCILQIHSINLEMEKSLCIISKNQGTYTLESFKHCQEKTRRESASVVEEFSRRSRQSVRRCFDESLQNLKELLKTRANFEDKNFAATTHNPKDNAFQVLGFPAKMSYQHRSKLRKLTGRFVRLSYLIDFIHLNGLAGIFKTQIQNFSLKLNKLQIQSQAQVICSKQRTKQGFDDSEKQKMFNIQLVFKPEQVSQTYINEVVLETFDISMKIELAAQLFNPLYHIRERQPQVIAPHGNSIATKSQLIVSQQQAKQTRYRKYIPTICYLWLTMKPTLDNIFDQLSFLIKQSMSSLKYFQRWSKHRQMQKYINILQQWDDIVSENWQISQNDNLDPISIIQNLQSSMSRIKQMLQISENKLSEKIIQTTTEPLNIYWQNTQADVDQLLTNPNIENSAQTIEYYLAYMSQWTDKLQLKIPNLIQLGIFTVNLDRMKTQVIDFMRRTGERFKQKLPQYVEQNSNELNAWLGEKSQILREEIHNIDDFVRLKKSVKWIDEEFHHKKQLCNDLGLIYQTMYNYKIQSKKRKQFQSNTLKAKDQLEQLLISMEQNIQRKTEFFTREVSRYHLPNLIKEIEKISDNIGSQEFQSLKSSSEVVIKKLMGIKQQYDKLKAKKQKCLEYLAMLKLSEVDVTELDELERQIDARLEMWKNLQVFNDFMKKIDAQVVAEMDLEAHKLFVTEKRQIVKAIEGVHNKPQNEVLKLLKSKVEKYFTNLPLLQGFNDKLSQSHWQQIDEILRQYPPMDLKKKQFTLRQFLKTGIGKQAKRIEYIFNKAKVENELQMIYSEVESAWGGTLVKSKTESKFVIIANPEVMREAFDYMLRTMCTILANPFSQTLRQYTLTYDTLMQHYNTFEHWLLTQQHLLKLDSMCRLLDIKKLPDYNQFQNCQKIYKNIMKHFMGNRSVELGVKMSKLFVVGIDDRLTQIDQGLKKVQENIKGILDQHRKNYPPYFIFSDEQMFTIITSLGSHQIVQSTVLRLIPGVLRLQFQNQRIVGVYNADNERLQRNPISMNLQMEQIIQQLSDTLVDSTRKAMRSCKYKTVETSIIKLIPVFHCQYLLAISKTDFTNYTQISIDNQANSSQSLKQFYKVMKKDIIQDLRIRSSIKQQFILRYDTLMLQSLYHEELLSRLIKGNVRETTDYEWQQQIRFYWDQGNNDDNNITVKQLHAKLKYGNEYIGSRTKVIIECDTNLLYALGQAETGVANMSVYQLQRVMNFIGQRLVVFDCCQFTTATMLTNVIITSWYWQTPAIFVNFNSLQDNVQEELLSRKSFREIKQSLLKKNSFNLKQSEKKQSAVFLLPRHQNYVHDFRGKCRVVNPIPMTQNYIKNFLRVKDVFETDNQISGYLMKLFQILNYLQERTIFYNLTIENFLQKQLRFNHQLTKKEVFDEFLSYIRPKIGCDVMSIMEETVRFELADNRVGNKDELAIVVDLKVSKTLSKSKSSQQDVQKQATMEKQKLSSIKRGSAVTSQKPLPALAVSPTKPIDNQKQATLTTTKSKLKTSKLPTQQFSSDKQKQQQVKSALAYRRVVILTGVGISKLQLLKTLYSSTHKIIEVFSSLQVRNLNKKGIITHYVESLRETETNMLFYFNGLNDDVLNEVESIWHNANYAEVKRKIVERNVYVVIATEKLGELDYSVISWLYIINVELQPEYLLEVGKQWSRQYFSQQPQYSLVFMKFFQQTLLGTFDNWSIKDIKHRQSYVYMFLTYLQSLLPARNLLQAMVYCFIRLFSNLDADYIKLEFLVKKLVGQDKVSEDEKVYELIYYNQQEQVLPGMVDGLVKSEEYFKARCEAMGLQSQSIYHENVITHVNYHYNTIMHRILTKTSAGIYLLGPTNSGKSTLYELYKQINFNNNSFLKLTMLDSNLKTQKFLQKILNNLNVWSLKQISSKINYQRSIIMVDDISFEGNSEFYDQNYQRRRNYNNECQGDMFRSPADMQQEKLTLIKQLLKYKLIEYPNTYYPKAFHNKIMTLQQVSFILSGKQQLEQFKECTIPLELTLQESQLKSIFSKYLRQRLNYFEINDLSIADIAATTYDICKKLSEKNSNFDGLELVTTKNILGKFMLLKLKESSMNLMKDVQKYWVYLLQQHLGIYDIKGPTVSKKILQTPSLRNSQTQSQSIKSPQGIIFKQLKNLNLQQIKPTSLCYSFLHTKSTQSLLTNEYSKKVQFVKDIKKIFNTINQKIQKYNSSENKRYGSTFQYIHFDEMIKKVVKVSNNLAGKDYLLYGRGGGGKESLVKLVAYLLGANYKSVNEGTLKQSIVDIFLGTNITTMSSFLLTKRLDSQSQISQLQEYYYSDFQNQILNNKQLAKPQRVYLKEKQKQRQRQRQRERQRQNNLKLINSSTNSSRSGQKQFASMGFGVQDYYIPPRQRLSQQDVIRYQQAIRVVILINDREIITRLPVKIKQLLMIDQLEEMPLASMQQYTTKFLAAEEITSSPKISLLLAQIWTYAKDSMQLTLRAYDDSVRLYCSFIDSLSVEIKQQLQKYSRVIKLFDKLKKLHQSLQKQVEKLHGKIKQLAGQIMSRQSEEKKQQKQVTEEEMHRRSAHLNKSEKVIEMLNALIPYFKQRHTLIQRYAMDRDYFEQSMAVAACYFTFMSDRPLSQRRLFLQSWYQNSDKIPLLQSSQPPTSFLTMFNLYPAEFNAEPIDDLEDFYENMAIVFNSVKPVFIRDSSYRGKAWLENVCSFVCVSEKESNFVDVICQNLTKPSNILIEINNQDTMNNLPNSFIHGLLFLSDTTETVNIKGQDYKVSAQAKFYVLLNQNVQISHQQKNEFTIVQFSESMGLLQKQLQYAMMSTTHPDVFFPQLDMGKKMRNLQLQKQALMLEIADNVYVAYEGALGIDQDDDESDESEDANEKGNAKGVNKGKGKKQEGKKQSKSPTSTPLRPEPTQQQLEQFISYLPDKTLTRGQNLSNKLKQKQQMCKQLQSKLSFTAKHTDQIRLFVQTAIQMYDILEFMSQKGARAHYGQYTYVKVRHVQFVRRITLGLRKKFIRVDRIETLLLFCVKVWGDQYAEMDFYVFIMAILCASQKLQHKLQFKRDQHHHQNYSHSHSNQHYHHKNKLTPTLIETLKSTTNYEDLRRQLNEKFYEFMSLFTMQMLMPYFSHSGSSSYLHDDDMRGVTLHNVWVRCDCGSRVFDQKLQQNLKIVKLQIKSSHNLQHEMKKYIFQENILLISSMELLENMLDHLARLGSHEKIIYFTCPLNQKAIERVVKLAKRYSVSEINHMYENKNPLLQQYLNRVQRQRDSHLLTADNNLKSIRSIKSNQMIRFDDGQQGNFLVDGSNKKQQANELNTITPREQQHSLSMKRSLKSEKNITDIQKQRLSLIMPAIITSIYSIISHTYLTHNLPPKHHTQSQIQLLGDFVMTCTFTDDQQFSFKDRMGLLLKTMKNFLHQHCPLIDKQIEKKFGQIEMVVNQEIRSDIIEDEKEQSESLESKLQELAEELQIENQHLLIKAQQKAKKVLFQDEYLSYFKIYFTNLLTMQQSSMDFQSLVQKASVVFEGIMKIDQPIVVKRNTKKSVNAIFKKQQLREKLLAQSAPSTGSVTNLQKKSAIKRITKHSHNTTPTTNQQQQQQQQQQNRKSLQVEKKKQSSFAPIVFQIEYKKLSSKINFLTKTIQQAIKARPKAQSIQLLLLLLQDNIPGAWMDILGERQFDVTSLQQLFKKYIRQQQDMSYCLDKLGRSHHAEVDLNLVKFPKDYLQLHFRSKLSEKSDLAAVYVLMNNPSNEELESSEEHVKIAAVQSAGWKFSASEANCIEIQGTDKPLSSESKLSPSCCILKKDISTVNITALSQIDVYESRQNPKPFMKVFALCKKMPNVNSLTNNNLSLYLKDSLNYS